jgi:hypothetical protein
MEIDPQTNRFQNGWCRPLSSNQPSIVQYLVDQGAQLDVRNRLGWTPPMITRGLFMANSKKLFPAAEEILVKALKAKGLAVQ